MSGTNATTSPNGLVNVASIIQTLAPLLLGSGKQTTTTGPTSTTQQGGGTNTTNSVTSTAGDPGAIAGLTSIANQALTNANDPSKTNDLVQNILTQSAQAFAPVLAQGNSAGLYNTSTMSLLSNEARARATQTAAQAVLNFQTSQQSIASSALGTVANANKTATTNGSTTANTFNTTNTGPTVQASIKAPAIDPMTSLMGLGGSFLLNKLGGSSVVKGLLDKGGDAISNFLGGGNSALSDAANLAPGQSASLPSAVNPFGPASSVSSDAALSNPALVAAEAPTTTTATAGLDLSAAPGADFGATSVGADIGGTAGEGIVDASGAMIIPDSASLESTGFAGFAGQDVSDLGPQGAALFDAATNASLADAVATTGFTAADILGGGAATLGSGIAGVAGGGIEVGAAADLGADLAGVAGLSSVGEGAGIAAASAEGIADFAPLLAALAWIVCTELTRQGKIPTYIYRYGYKKFHSYNVWGRRGYQLWGVPMKNYVRDNPDSRTTAVIAYLFLRRAHNIAVRGGCKDAKWTVIGAVMSGACYQASFWCGVYLGHKEAWKLGRFLKWKEIRGFATHKTYLPEHVLVK